MSDDTNDLGDVFGPGNLPAKLPESGRVRQENPEKSELAAKEDKDKSLYRILVCGDFGGVSKRKMMVKVDRDGNEVESEEDDGDTEEYPKIVEMPCQHPSSFGIPGSQYGITPGRCFRHTAERLDVVARKKASFLATYIEAPEKGVEHAVLAVGMKSASNVYYWKESDPEFRANMNAIAEIAEAILTDRVEETVIRAIEEWRPGAARLAEWWLVNRRGHKWKSLGKAEQGGTVPGPSFQGGKHVHIWKMGDETLTFE